MCCLNCAERKAFALSNESAMPIFYKSLVHPDQECGNLFWGLLNIKDIKLVESVHRRATKMSGKINLKPEDFIVISNGRTSHKFEVKKKKAFRKASTNIFSNRIVNGGNSYSSDEVNCRRRFHFKRT